MGCCYQQWLWLLQWLPVVSATISGLMSRPYVKAWQCCACASLRLTVLEVYGLFISHSTHVALGTC